MVRITDILRTAIVCSGQTLSEIERSTGVPDAVLSRFVRGRQGLHDTTVDRLMAHFDLKIVGANGQPPPVQSSR